MMELNELTAISPVDGRYGSKTAAFRELFSEYGLIKHRVLVEVRWFQALCAHPGIPELPPLSRASSDYLDELLARFDEDTAQRVKDIEATTNHDVKAVENLIKEKIADNRDKAELARRLVTIDHLTEGFAVGVAEVLPLGAGIAGTDAVALLEEIVGEFTTDPATSSKDIHPQEDGSFLVDGSANIRELNRIMQWDLPTDGPKTLSGLILEYLESFPGFMGESNARAGGRIS